MGGYFYDLFTKKKVFYNSGLFLASVQPWIDLFLALLVGPALDQQGFFPGQSSFLAAWCECLTLAHLLEHLVVLQHALDLPVGPHCVSARRHVHGVAAVLFLPGWESSLVTSLVWIAIWNFVYYVFHQSCF